MEDVEIELTPIYKKYVFGSNYKAIIQVGGRFSGKSYNSQIEMICNMTNKKKHKILVIEDLDKGLTKGYYAGLVDKIDLFRHDKAYKPIISPPEIRHTLSKNIILFSGYATDQQKKAVKALDQITAIIVEEAEWMRYDDFTALLHQLRGGIEEDRKLTLLLNPVDPDCFVNQYFIETIPDKVFEYFPGTNRPKVFEKNIETTFVYNDVTYTDVTKALIVLSTHHDNPHLSIAQRATIEKLKETDPDKYLQLGEARFIHSSGVYFPEFKRDIHVIEPFQIPKHWNRYVTMDYGLDMLACYWIALDTQNNAYVYKELYKPDLIISEAAKEIIRLTTEDEDIRTYYAPPDLWNRRQDTGKSAADIFMENGIVLLKAENKRVLGWYNLKEWIKPIERRDEQTGKTKLTSRLQITNNCSNLIRTIAKIERDEKDANDCASEPHELTHAPDGIRYFFADRPAPSDNPTIIDLDIDDDDDEYHGNKNSFYN